MNEAAHPYSGPGGHYIAYPIVAPSAAMPTQYADVSNNITGGYSVTAAGHHTDPFEVTPWAVGKNSGLNNGDAVPTNTTFTFELDLNAPGVLPYLQDSLSKGGLAFFFSSVHPASQPGTVSNNAYPVWYLREYGVLPPTLTVDYDIVTTFPPGDYDHSGSVTVADYNLWRSTFGNSVAAGSGADGNSDGIVNGADYIFWRDHIGRCRKRSAGILRGSGAHECCAVGAGYHRAGRGAAAAGARSGIFRSRGSHSIAGRSSRFYARRAAGRDRDHRHLDCDFAAGDSGSPRSGAADELPE